MLSKGLALEFLEFASFCVFTVDTVDVFTFVDSCFRFVGGPTLYWHLASDQAEILICISPSLCLSTCIM